MHISWRSPADRFSPPARSWKRTRRGHGGAGYPDEMRVGWNYEENSQTAISPGFRAIEWGTKACCWI